MQRTATAQWWSTHKPEIRGPAAGEGLRRRACPLTVQAMHTGAVRVTLDGADAAEPIAAGDGFFTGALPVRGAIDNGSHAIEVIATLGPYEDLVPRFPRLDARTGHRGVVAGRARGQPHEPRRGHARG